MCGGEREHVTMLWEKLFVVCVIKCLKMKCVGAMEEVCYLKAVLSLAVQDNNRREQVKLFRQLQQKLLLMRDMGNEKLQVTSRMCELVSALNLCIVTQ